MRKYFPAYRKVVFRAYQDRDFKNPIKRGELDEHLGIMGPVLKAEINDILTVSFFIKRRYYKPLDQTEHCILTMQSI